MALVKNIKLLIAICIAIPVVLFSGCTKEGYIANKTSVMGVDLGGKTYEEAVACLETLSLDDFVTVKADDITFSISAEEVNASYDSRGTVEQIAKTNSGIFSGLMKKEYDICVTLEDDLLNQVLENKLYGIECEVSDTFVSIGDEGLLVTNGKSGKKLEREKIKELICSEFGKSEKEDIEVSFVVTEPSRVDYENLLADFSDTFKETEYIMDENGNITVTEGSAGVVFNTEEVINVMKQHVTEGESYLIPCEVQLPKYTKEYLEECLFRDTMSSYSSNFSTSSANRASNVALAAKSINDTILMPGDVFSFNSALGERTVANGYKVAGAYVGGKTVDQVGGGICQVSSTLYNTVLLSNLEIVERRNHQMTVSYVPIGRDATVNWGTTDFRFKNNTDFPVKIVGEINGKNVKISMVGTKEDPGMEVKIETSTVSVIHPGEEYVEDSEMYVGESKTEKGHTGYVVDAVRVVYSNGVPVSRENLTRSRYNATNNIITIGTKEYPTEETQTVIPETAPEEYEMPAWLIPSN